MLPDWPGTGIKKVNGWTIAFSGRDDGFRRQGVAVAISPSASRSFIGADPVSEGVLLASFQLKGNKLTLVAAYATTDDYSDEQKGIFYSELQEAVDRVPSRDVLIIAGDFNAQLGAEHSADWQGCLGLFALKKPRLRTSHNSLRLLTFCVENGIVVRSSFNQHKDIHLATWIGPAGDRANQIDFLLMRWRDARYMQDCRVYRRTGFETDHYPLVGICSFNMRKAPRHPRVKKHSARLMLDKEVQQNLNDIVAKELSAASQTGNSEDDWQQF